MYRNSIKMLILAGTVFAAKDCSEKMILKQNDKVLNQKIQDIQIQNEVLINQVLDLQTELLQMQDQIDGLKSEVGATNLEISKE